VLTGNSTTAVGRQQLWGDVSYQTTRDVIMEEFDVFFTVRVGAVQLCLMRKKLVAEVGDIVGTNWRRLLSNGWMLCAVVTVTFEVYNPVTFA
jgi:hypothetical protein